MMDSLQRWMFRAALAVVAGCAAVHGSPGGPGQPNVLFIIADDLCTALSGYGHAQCSTPNLDRLAGRGVRFDRAYCQFPVCGPSRASVMTGLYPEALGEEKKAMTGFRVQLPGITTLPQLFRQNGYVASRVSKIYHMGVPGDILRGSGGADDEASWDAAINIKGPEQNAPGKREHLSPKMKHPGMAFIKVEAEGDDCVHADGMAAERAKALLNRHRDEPFFLAVGFVRPHVPLVAPARYFLPYPPDRMALPDHPQDDLEDVPEPAGKMANPGRYGMNGQQKKKALGAYYASVAYMDAQVGKLLDEVARLGLEDRTIIVFTSDHGYNLGQHDCWQKLSLFEDSVRVPLIISVPGLQAGGRTCHEVVELIDLYPTLADLCGLEAPGYLQGSSLRPLLEDGQPGWNRKAAYTVTHLEGRSVRVDNWRFNLWGGDAAAIELYDHDNDPGEFTNLAHDPEHAGLVKRFIGIIDGKRRLCEDALRGIPRNAPAACATATR